MRNLKYLFLAFSLYCSGSFFQLRAQTFCPSDSIFARGIDISHYNADPDWDNLEVDFVFLKATEGRSYVDPTFKSRLEGAKKRNIPVGAYHFFRALPDSCIEAENYFKTVGFDVDIIPVVDIEKKPADVSDEQFLQRIKGLLDCFRSKYGCLPIIYTHEDFYKANIAPVIERDFKDENIILWLGEIDRGYNELTLNPHIHQAKIKNVKGIRGAVDYNELHCPIENLVLK